MHSHSKRIAVAAMFLFLALTAVPAASQEDPRATTLAHGTDILAGVELEASTPIAVLLADPDEHDGTVLQVEGTVVAMCQMMGCWVSLDDGDGNRINVKVDDGVVDLREMTAAEHYMIAEGVFQTGENGAQIYIMEHGARVHGAETAS